MVLVDLSVYVSFKRKSTLIFSLWDEIELSGRYVIIIVIFVAVQYSGKKRMYEMMLIGIGFVVSGFFFGLTTLPYGSTLSAVSCE